MAFGAANKLLPVAPKDGFAPKVSTSITVATAATSATPSVATVAGDNSVAAVSMVSPTSSAVAPVGGQYSWQI